MSLFSAIENNSSKQRKHRFLSQNQNAVVHYHQGVSHKSLWKYSVPDVPFL